MSPLYYAIYYMCYLEGEDQRFRRAFYQFSSKSLEHECNILLPFFTNPFSALPHFQLPGRKAQSVGHLTHKSEVLGSILGLATYFRFSFG